MEGIKAKLKAIFGAANVSDDPKVLAGYASDKSFAKTIAPAYVVKASNADQVEALVKFANEAKLPLIPVSSGAPHYRGDTVPSVAGAVIACGIWFIAALAPEFGRRRKETETGKEAAAK